MHDLAPDQCTKVVPHLIDFDMLGFPWLSVRQTCKRFMHTILQNQGSLNLQVVDSPVNLVQETPLVLVKILKGLMALLTRGRAKGCPRCNQLLGCQIAKPALFSAGLSTAMEHNIQDAQPCQQVKYCPAE